uniref:Protein CHAPERONE-LIKE PROTEIN OF POR1, chloroplastic n=1 Tax=Elaeis guineensis var. tenera TaxID=51953 RepID=A0A6J0PHF4_ELAGV|nr:protein CHAPERONE-LIKE PROTEIN OF POR1, chloroplastic [Elaeis guineensis]XP_019705348.1 protein CHAPERONE-LIKE PROTEIN OF POR1, chloroplastic [Elaeis guineensis]XP_029119937.1 protein CHAPERONE-LIKE PROTEIN OF POR1, chloroplastic [Elaeis guineensis]XP_029119938.1 protein CHAPERONE-LIKE PROTEIN OF POR1, chloroplastic [Elaeis guineensis]
MPACGLSCSPSRISSCMVSARKSSSLHGLASPFTKSRSCWERVKHLSCIDRNYLTPLVHKHSATRNDKIRSRIYASFGDMADDSTAIFPRIDVKDPYKRLGISREASEEEIQAARNFLINKYAGHKPSVDAIESAHDKIIMQSFLERKNPKININKKIREVTQSRVVKAIASRFEAPSTNAILKTASAFIVLGILTVLFPTEEGPTLQVAISLIVTIYFIYQRLKSRLRAFLYGIGAFFGSWLLGTFLMVSVVPPLLQGPRSLEVSTSLISYILLWVSSTYVK